MTKGGTKYPCTGKYNSEEKDKKMPGLTEYNQTKKGVVKNQQKGEIYTDRDFYRGGG